MNKILTNPELTNIFIITFPGLNVLLETPSAKMLQENTLSVFPTSFGVLFEENTSANDEEYVQTCYSLSGNNRILSIYPALDGNGDLLKELPSELKIIVPLGCFICIVNKS